MSSRRRIRVAGDEAHGFRVEVVGAGPIPTLLPDVREVHLSYHAGGGCHAYVVFASVDADVVAPEATAGVKHDAEGTE